MSDVACNVVGCRFVADGVIAECGNFPVCALHDAPQTRAILETLQRPHHYRHSCGRPMVMPCGTLGEDDLRTRAPIFAGLHAYDDPELLAGFSGPNTIFPAYDLTRDR